MIVIKKVLLFIMLLAAVGGLVSAQTSVVLDGPIPSNKGSRVIREQGVSFYEEEGVGTFVYITSYGTTPPGSAYSAKTPEGWVVKDFHVQDGLVFFCGTDSLRGEGLLGYFFLSELMSGSGVVTYYRDVNLSGRLAVLNRIAIGGDKAGMSVMAIGNVEPPESAVSETGSNRVVYYENYSTGVGCIFAPVEDGEVFWDVVATNTMFAVTGAVGFDMGMMIMRRAPIGTSVAAFLSAFELVYQYQFPVAFTGGVRAAALYDDDMATAVHYQDMTHMGIRLSTIDAATGNMICSQYTTQWIAGATIPNTMPKDMVFLPAMSHLMLVDGSPYLMCSAVLSLKPYETVFYSPDFYFLYKTDDSLVFRTKKVSAVYSVCALQPGIAIALDGDDWMVLESSTLPANCYRKNCIGTYRTDVFPGEVTAPNVSINGAVDAHLALYDHYQRDIIIDVLANCSYRDGLLSAPINK